MNKQLKYIGGGIFFTLLISSAIILTTYDQTTLTYENEDQGTTFLNFEKRIDAAQISFNPAGVEAATGFLPGAPATVKTNLTKLTSAIQFVSSPIIDPSAPRLETYISTSKMVYRPNDVIFIEVAVFDALQKVPYVPPRSQNNTNNNQTQPSQNPIQIQLAITDDQGVLLPNGYLEGIVNDTTASFAYKLPANFVSDIILITAGGAIPVPSQTYVMVQGPPPPSADNSTNNTNGNNSQNSSNTQQIPYNVNLRFFQANYSSGDFVTGGIKLVSSNQVFPRTLTYNYTVKIPKADPIIMASQVPYDRNMQGFFKFQIPASFNTSLAVNTPVIITIQSQVGKIFFTQDFIVPIRLPQTNATINPTKTNTTTNNTQPQLPVVDPSSIQVKFVTESGSDLVINATNKVYFYAFIADPQSDEDFSKNFFNFNQGMIVEVNTSAPAPQPTNNTNNTNSTVKTTTTTAAAQTITLNNMTFLVTRNITKRGDVSASYKGIGSFLLTPKAGLNYVLDIAVPGSNVTAKIPIEVDTIENHMMDEEDAMGNMELPSEVEALVNQTLFDLAADFFNNMTNNGNNNQSGSNNGTTCPMPDQPEEILFGLSKRVIGNSDSLIVRFQTNNLVNPSDAYVLLIKLKEKVIYSDIYYFQKNQALNVTIPATNINLINGGTLYANLYKLTPDFWTFYNQSILNNTAGFCDLDMSEYTELGLVDFIVEKLLPQFLDEYQQNMQQQSGSQNTYSQKPLEFSVFATTTNTTNTTTNTTNNTTSNSTTNQTMTNNTQNSTGSNTTQPQNGTTNGTSSNTTIGGNNGTTPNNNTNNTINNGTNNNGTNNNNTNVVVIPQCVQVDYETVENFLQIKGSIMFFKKPAPSNTKVQVQTKTNKYLAGDLVEFNVTIINTTTNKPITQDAYVNIFVTEDRPQIPGLNDVLVTFPGKMFMQNEAFDPNFDFLNPLQAIDYMYGPSNSSDLRLELYMATQMQKEHIYEMDSLKMINWMLPWASPLDAALIQKSFGFNFGQGLNLTEVLNEQQDQQSSGNNDAPSFPPGFQMVFGGLASQVPDLFYQNIYDTVTDFVALGKQTDFMTNIDPNTKQWSHPLYQNYSRSDAIDRSTDLFYGSGLKVVNGTYRGSFRLSDLITTFKFNVNSYTSNGVLGNANYSIQTVQPFSFDFSLPKKMVVGDNYTFSVAVQNLNQFNLTANLTGLQIDNGFILDSNQFVPFVVPANQARFLKNFTISASDKNVNASFVLGIKAVSADGLNTFTGTYGSSTKIDPRAVSRSVYQSGELVYGVNGSPSSASIQVTFPDQSTILTFQGSLTLYPSLTAYLQDSIQALSLNSKQGSLEELLSYLWSLQMYLEQLNLAYNQTNGDALINAKIIEATQMAIDASQNLVQYQVFDNKGVPSGFEFLPQQTVGNEQATAFALMVLGNMPFLNNTISSATQYGHMKWLQSKRVKNAFPQNSGALDAKTRPPQNLTNAHIITTLTMTNLAAFGNFSTTNLTNDTVLLITAARANISNTNLNSDPYILALTLMSSVNMRRLSDASALATELLRYQNTTTGAFSLGLTNYVYTAFNTFGNDRVVETTALAVLALKATNQNKTYDAAIQSANSWLKKQYNGGLFGSSYATVLALLAIGGSRDRVQNSVVPFDIGMDGQTIYSDTYNDNAQYYYPQKLSIDNSDNSLAPNTNSTFSIALGKNSGAGNPYFGYSIQFSYDDFSYAGAKAIDSGLNFTVAPKYQNNTLGSSKINASMSYDLTVTNLNPFRTTGTVLITIRSASCLNIDYGVLQSLVKSGKINYYTENTDIDEVYLFIRGLSKSEARVITVSFLQGQNGKCLLRPFSAQFFKIQGSDVMNTAKF